jgi:hypothetical protein
MGVKMKGVRNMNTIERLNEKALNSSNRSIFDKAYNTLTQPEQNRLQGISNNWYKDNTKKVKIELLAENTTYMFLIQNPIYGQVVSLFNPEIKGYEESTLICLDDHNRIKLSQSEVNYFKAIRKEMQAEIYYKTR